MKTCTSCGVDKALLDFNKDNKQKDKLCRRCRACTILATKTWRQNNKDYVRAQNKEWKKNNPDVVKARNKRWQLKNKFNLTEAKYEEMLASQNNCCKICSKPQEDLPKKLAVDHCHITGKIRGLLCSNCNIYLGYIKENIDSAKNLVSYINENPVC